MKNSKVITKVVVPAIVWLLALRAYLTGSADDSRFYGAIALGVYLVPALYFFDLIKFLLRMNKDLGGKDDGVSKP